MAVLYSSGWEAGTLAWYQSSTAVWRYTGGTAINSSTTYLHRTLLGYGGNYSMYVDDALFCAPGTVVAGVARWLHFYEIGSGPGATLWGVQFGILGTLQSQVVFNTDGSIQLYRGGTLLATFTSAYVSTIGHWYAIECTCQDAGGVINVYVDGALVAYFVGDTKSHASLTDWDCFGWANAFGSGHFNNNMYIDDIVVTDATTGMLQEHYIVPLTISSDASPQTLTGSAPHYAQVNAVPANDATYVAAYGSTSGEDFFGLSALPTSNSILCINVCARVVRDGLIQHAEVAMNSGATTMYASPVIMAASGNYLDMQYIQETDPDTGLAWDNAGIAGLKIGLRFTV